MKKILVTGSIAYDHIMFFDGEFKDSIIPEELDHLSVSFLAKSRNIYFGGCSCNIAYSLKLLNENPEIVGVAGDDFTEYSKWLLLNKISTSRITIDKNNLTPAAYILNDKKQRQITIFSPAAMQNPKLGMKLNKIDRKSVACAIISADLPLRMKNLSKLFVKNKIPYIFDPGQALPILKKEDLLFMIKNSMGVMINEYEADLICKILDTSIEKLLKYIKFFIKTLGEKGVIVYWKDKNFLVKAIPNLKVADITGCGDAFRAGFLHGYVNELPLKRCLEIANTTASFVVEKLGTQNHRFDLKKFNDRLVKYYGA